MKVGYEDRERHIVEEFARHSIPVNWFLDHDIPDLSEEDKQSPLRPAEVSLTQKHVGIWRDFLDTDLPFCLVFEDDVFLARNFVPRFNDCLRELAEQQQAVVYLGNAGNYYTPRSKLIAGKSLYPATHSRCADSYVLTRSAAAARLKWFNSRRPTRPVDIEVNYCDEEAGTEILWFERPIVEQGSHNGRFKTSVTPNRGRALWIKRLEWAWKKYRRQIFGHTVRD